MSTLNKHTAIDVLKMGYPEGHRFWKYWARRYDIFSEFDNIAFDYEGLYSAKPERSAEAIAQLLLAASIIDPFCGIGGVTIACARRGKFVQASDICGKKVRMAKHNAKVYNVEKLIHFRRSSASDVLSALTPNDYAIYLDPPWGGAAYIERESFGLSDFCIHALDLRAFIHARHEAEIALSVPINFDFSELASLGRRFETYRHDSPGRNSIFTVHFPPRPHGTWSQDGQSYRS